MKEQSRLKVILADYWVRIGTDSWMKSLGSTPPPGFLFWRNEALTEVLKVLLKNQSLTPDVVKQTRRRLGLQPFGHGTLCIWRSTIKRAEHGKTKIAGYFRDDQRAF